MPEHLIRLRGPWQLRTSTDPQAGSARIVLPAETLPTTPEPIELSRQFGRPARTSASVSCRLRCESVPGVRSIRLNGDFLFDRSPEDPAPFDRIEVPIPGPLRLRNQLELTVDGHACRFASPDRPWGSIVLVFAEDDENPRVDESDRLTR